jgi:aryl-alcohol dehydrogenase-like predicted oxidoreductase
MKKRRFGKTDLHVSEVGFGAWAIGGPAMAGDVAIGWGPVDDTVSINALKTAADRGVNFIDTADFYGLGHSEDLIGRVFGNNPDIIVATKVGHRLKPDQKIVLDYSKEYIMSACENSLRRLRRDSIDYYQLHSATLTHLENDDCIEAMELLRKQGKVRYWGISLNTYNPFPEADYFLKNKLGFGFQLVFNIINQRSLSIIEKASQNKFGIIARMPLQFGLLTGKFNALTRFKEDDHRYFRLKPEILEKAIEALKEVWLISQKLGITNTELSLSFILGLLNVSTVIPGIKTPEQAILNTTNIKRLKKGTQELLLRLYDTTLFELLQMMEEQEG